MNLQSNCLCTCVCVCVVEGPAGLHFIKQIGTTFHKAREDEPPGLGGSSSFGLPRAALHFIKQLGTTFHKAKHTLHVIKQERKC